MSEKILQLNEEIIKGQIRELVRGSVEETLNELLEKEAESLTQATRYERSEARQGYRSGHYDRNLTTTSGDVTLYMPRLKGVSFETATPGGIAAGRAAWRKPSSRCIWQPRSQTARPKQSEINGGCIVAAAVYLIRSPVPNQQTDLTQKN